MTETSTATDVVLYEATEGIATITFNRPDRLNAFTPELGRRYFDLLARAGDDDTVRVIVVTGAGRGWCAGADMEVLQGIGTGDGQRDIFDERQQSFPLTVPKPIIAAVNGACAGIGFSMALMCDLRFAAAGAKFTTAFSRRGLIAEHGSSWVLPRLVGPSRALDLLYSARVVLAEEAKELGLVDQVFAPEELIQRTRAYASDLARNCSPTSMAVIKRQVYSHLTTELAPAIDESNRLMVESLSRGDFREGVASFVEKREPSFGPVDAEA